MSKLVSHLRHNAIAYLALFVALGGTSYAAYSLPAGSVGTRQLRNHAIEPVKLNRSLIGGYIRAWVSVDETGHEIAGSRGVAVRPSDVAPGYTAVVWHQRPHARCEVLATQVLPSGASAPQSPGYVVTRVDYFRAEGETSIVQTFNSQGQPAALPYDLTLLCSTP
jgi:hypothetical protein